jgi:beta-fructofuranosidase
MTAHDPFQNDRHRPRYHFLPPGNWMNDPNGLIQHQGRYHLFYQYNPHGAFWGTIHWGHAISSDLVHWEHMPVALAPSPDGPDADGCYSGCAVVHDGIPTLIYTGVRGNRELACLATSNDGDLATWTKYPGNPVIAAPPEELQTTMFRDHSVWREHDAWYQVIGSGIRDVGGAALLYRSRDLVSWEYLHPLCVETPEISDPEHPSLGWECPDFFEIDEKRVLIACFWDGDPIFVRYLTGDFEDERFLPGRQGVVDAGECFYAPQSFTDEQGRRVMFGWLREARDRESQIAAGWSGVMSLPRVLMVHPDGSLGTAPAAEVLALRGCHQRFHVDDLLPGGNLPLQGIHGDALEIIAEFMAVPAGLTGLQIRCADDGSEGTSIIYDAERSTLSLDTRQASRDPGANGSLAVTHVDLGSDEPARLRVFVDRSVVEAYLNDRICITGRVYPTREDSLRVRVMAPDRQAILGPVDVWAMRDA